MVDVIYADSYGRERGFLRFAEGDFAVGKSNSFQLKVPPDLGIARNWYLMVEGTEFGGLVDGFDIDTRARHAVAIGRTWSGLLATGLVKPPPGQSHRTASGDLNAIIQLVIDLLGLGYCMQADPRPSGIAADSWAFTREGESMDGYSQLRALCRAHGAKLRIRYDGALRKAVVGAVERSDYTGDGLDGDKVGFTLRTRRPVNHLHCMGAGVGADRVTVDLFADEQGRISRTQTQFGPAHVEQAYDNPSADEDELVEYGTRHLRDEQAERERCGLNDADDGSYDIDDIVGGTSTAHGISVTTTVAMKTATVGRTITYQTFTETEV